MDRMLRLAPFALLLALWAGPGLAQGAPEAPRPLDHTTRDFDQLHMDIHVTPDLAKGTVRGRVTHHVRALVDGLAAIRLHSQDTKILKATSGTAVLKTELDGKRGILTVHLGTTLPKGTETRITIEYLSTPTRGLYFHRPTEACPETPWFMYSQGQGTDNRRWIPCYDEPDDRCTWNLSVKVREDLQTVSNGVLGRSTHLKANPALRVDHWRFGGRSPTYLITLVVGKLETISTKHDGVLLDFNAPPGHTEELKTSLAETATMLDFFGEYLQAPYPWKRYAQTYVWDFLYGGMENTTATTLNMRALHTKAIRPNYRSEGLVAHELAHMWFGDYLTCRTWKHIWLNEGFATYFTDLFFEHRYGRESFLLRRRRQNKGYMKGTPKASELKLERDPRGDIPLELFGGKQYSRGAAILNNLRRHVGDEVFRDSIRAYVARYKDSTVTSEDLRTVTEEIAGEDLGWFWNQWVYGLGYPKIDVRYDDKAQQLIVRQTQKQAGGQGLFRLRVPIRWGNQTASTTYTIHKERHAFPMPRGGAFLRFGVGGDLLMQATVHQSHGAWAEALRHDRDVTGRVDAAEALEAFGPASVSPLRHALEKDPSWAVRQTAAEVLGRMDADFTAEALLMGATDTDSRVRAAVFDGLARKKRRLVGAAVAKAAREDPHPSVRAAAARAAGKLKVQDAYDLLLGMLTVESDQDAVRTGAIDGLKALGDARACEAIPEFLHYRWGKGANHVLRQAALNCLLTLKPDDKDVHAHVVPLVRDPYHRMRSWAAEACGKYGIRAAIPELVEVSTSDWNGGVKGK
ncbi:MAG: M1 family aminopeptidase, partial [Planctomycetota bacterium]|nr:M1 family aminopeptidase [Planctomycetota bacterium]